MLRKLAGLDLVDVCVRAGSVAVLMSVGSYFHANSPRFAGVAFLAILALSLVILAAKALTRSQAKRVSAVRSG